MCSRMTNDSMCSITTLFVHCAPANDNGIDQLNEGRLEHLATADVHKTSTSAPKARINSTHKDTSCSRGNGIRCLSVGIVSSTMRSSSAVP